MWWRRTYACGMPANASTRRPRFTLSPAARAELLRAFRRRLRLWVSFGCAVIALGFAHVTIPLWADGTPTLVASRSIEPGRALTRADVTLTRIDASARPKGAISSLAQIPRGATVTRVPAGMPITTELLDADRMNVRKNNALTSVPVHDPAILELMKNGTSLVLSCAGDTAGDASTINATARPSHGSQSTPSGPAALAEPSQAFVLVEISKSDLEAVTHCTRQGPLIAAVVG